MPSLDDGQPHETQEFFRDLEPPNLGPATLTVKEWMEASGPIMQNLVSMMHESTKELGGENHA